MEMDAAFYQAEAAPGADSSRARLSLIIKVHPNGRPFAGQS